MTRRRGRRGPEELPETIRKLTERLGGKGSLPTRIEALEPDKAEQAANVLKLIRTGITSMLGDDDVPSDFWRALEDLEGTDADALELGQDGGLLAAGLLECIEEAILSGDKNALIGSLFALLLGDGGVPEIVTDIQEIEEG